MIVLQCHGCGKSHNLKDEFAGKKVKCPCGTGLTVPGGGGSALIDLAKPGITCPHCQATIQAHWKGCPACGESLLPNVLVSIQAPPPAPTPKPVSGSSIQVGNNSVVKADINQSVNVNAPAAMAAHFLGGVGMPPPTPAHIPSVHVGDGSVVKAHIDASTNVNHHGQFVAQQTIVNVNESSVASLVKLLTGKVFTETALKEADAQIDSSNDPVQLQSILAQTLRHMIRELKKLHKERFGNSIRTSQPPPSILETFFADDGGLTASVIASGIDKVNFLRLRSCHKILDKLHDIAAESQKEESTRDVEALDDCILSIEKMFKWKAAESINIKLYVCNMFSLLLGGFGLFIIFIVLINDRLSVKETASGLFFGILLLLLASALAYGGWIFNEKRKKQFTDSMDEAESVLGDLIKKTKLS